MNKEEIHLYDIQRILLGNAPVSFLIETFIRTLIVFFVLILVLRWMGSRMSGQLTITEMGIMLMLGAIVSAAVEMPDRGILWGIVALLLIGIFQRGVTYWMMKNEKLEAVTQGVLSVLVKDGRMQLQQMKDANISKEQLFAVLRNKQIYNLGKVQRVYLEGCGAFSTYQYNEQKEGLSLMPELDNNINNERELSHTEVCFNCGALKKQSNVCEVCGEQNWTKAIKG
jgi:uncharacterized membrane protein YcaP (DUF421 family)